MGGASVTNFFSTRCLQFCKLSVTKDMPGNWQKFHLVIFFLLFDMGIMADAIGVGAKMKMTIDVFCSVNMTRDSYRWDWVCLGLAFLAQEIG
ncbi:hypothetical protein EYC84_001221 [Monilinia fructicola]|uniref:Uncharacterized protein n=1 Tax=Monilinia fructicola TaxID=38448 RepID=A0A5M9JP84_MONFR|nr:hypothetical protein EYC84_001221 [Monilinia fructicola]